VAKVSTPTSAIGISEAHGKRRSKRAHAPRASGFTLLELLVVVTIIGLVAGTVMLSAGIVRSERDIEREVLRLQSLLNLAREEAIMQSREFAVLFGESSYRFYVYDHFQQRWVDPPDDALLRSHQLAEPISVDLRVEGRDLVLEPPQTRQSRQAREGRDDRPQPQVMILSSGEMTPFEAQFFRDFSGGRVTLSAELDGSFEVTKEGFDGT
jgi:general secretion pathway protein H